jgi:SSS family solute:Na+ symporter
VAVSDTISGVLVLGLALYVVYAALKAIGFDLSSIPSERLTMIGDANSPIPFPTLFTGMLLIQIFYWSTNQTITQRAMAAPSIREAQKGVVAAAGIRLLIVPAIVVLPGIVAFEMFGDIGDEAYGRITGVVLPSWLGGVFAAAIAAAVLTSFNSVLNSSATLFVMDLYRPYRGELTNVARTSNLVSITMAVIGILFVPLYQRADSLINLVQQLNGLLSMPILSAFAVGLLFRNVAAGAAMIGVVLGVAFYAFVSFVWQPVHYIHAMAIVFAFSGSVSLLTNRLVFGQNAQFVMGGSKASLA